MIEESLLKSNFAGKDGFIWWVGQVADPKSWRNEKSRVFNDGSWAYRCKVRIVGYHTFDGNVLPDDDLPWAHILTSAADGAPGQGGFGKNPNIIGGETVLGFFLDGEEAQQPIVVSCFYRNKSVKNLITPELVKKEKSSQFKPFTGMQGNLSARPTRIKQPKDGQVKQPPKTTSPDPINVQKESDIDFSSAFNANIDFGSTETFNSDLNLGISSLTTPNYSASYADSLGTAGSLWDTQAAITDQLFYDDAAHLGMFSIIKNAGPVEGDNGCYNNFIAQLQNALQSFIRLINGLEKTIYGYIDPIRNVVVNVQQNIRRVARLMASIVKFIMNGMRDNISKLIGCLFRVFAKTIPLPQWLQLSEAAKNILNIIFCIFEKLFGPIWDFIQGLLDGLIGKSSNIPVCAVEETIAAIIGKIGDLVSEALETVLSGIDWLTDGVGQIFDYINGAVSQLNQILGFLTCDRLKCKPVPAWDPFGGVKFPSTDDWAKALNNFDLLGGSGAQVDEWASLLSMYGGDDTIFIDCREQIVNPQTQDDIDLPVGTSWYYCIPPEVKINGNGVGAKAVAVIDPTFGSVLTIKVTDPGTEYTKPPTVTIVDKSNYGKGALAKATINDTGNIESIYIVEPGSGYCQTNLTVFDVGIGSTDPATGIGTTTPTTGIGSTVIGISTTPVGIVTSIVVEKPGFGYTSGDTINVGSCVYSPVLTTNGSIIGITSAAYCKSEFKTTPALTINTNTGQGALLYPVLQYVPQYVVDNPNNLVGIVTVVNVDQCI